MEVVPGTELTAERVPENMVFTWTHLIPKELLATIAVLTGLNLLSVFFNAPLEQLANSTVTPNPAKAPWYFLGLQELVHYSAFLGGVLLPFLIVVGLLVLPYVDTAGRGSGVWFARERRLQNTIFTLFVAAMVVLILVGSFFRGANWKLQWPW